MGRSAGQRSRALLVPFSIPRFFFPSCSSSSSSSTVDWCALCNFHPVSYLIHSHFISFLYHLFKVHTTPHISIRSAAQSTRSLAVIRWASFLLFTSSSINLVHVSCLTFHLSVCSYAFKFMGCAENLYWPCSSSMLFLCCILSSVSFFPSFFPSFPLVGVFSGENSLHYGPIQKTLQFLLLFVQEPSIGSKLTTFFVRF